jgi:uncharacterized protein YcfL
MRKYLIILLVIFGFVGCGVNNTTTESSSDDTPSAEKMVLNKAYTLEDGAKINKLSDDATIKIVQNSNEDKPTYTLIKGEAEIIR